MASADPFVFLQQAKLIHSKQVVNSAIAVIAKNLNQAYANKQPTVLVVMNGGLFFSGQLLPKLTFPLNLDYVHATRYQGERAGDRLHWIVKPPAHIKNKEVLILDDILDEGITLKAIVEECLRLGASDIKVAVLADKLINKSKPICADYVELTVPNQYVFGCGMDIEKWWRNLPEIYALPDSK